MFLGLPTSETQIIQMIKGFKIQFYIFLLFTFILLAIRVIRSKLGISYSRKILIYPMIYLLLTLYSSIDETFFLFEIAIIIYMIGYIIGFVVGDLANFKEKRGKIVVETSVIISSLWSILFLIKWYFFLYYTVTSVFIFVVSDILVTYLFTLLAGVLLGQASGIIFKHWRFPSTF